eukprot:COSAG01_NODE_50360_length_364_cov_0.577358_1_plen_50_part_10
MSLLHANQNFGGAAGAAGDGAGRALRCADADVPLVVSEPVLAKHQHRVRS